MGITIHYAGHIKDMALIPQLQNEFSEICETLNWRYSLMNEDLNQPMDVSIEYTDNVTKVEGHVPLKGIIIQVDPDVETMDLLFNAKGKLISFVSQIFDKESDSNTEETWVFVKTQFGSVNSHIAIVKLLRYLQKKYVPDLQVLDEGEYWETENKNRLLELRGFLFTKMNQLTDALSKAEIPQLSKKEDLIAQIESIIKRYLEKGGND